MNTIQHLTPMDFTTLTKQGVKSVQLVWAKNSADAQVTITRVTMEPSAIQARHSHPKSEQIWIVEQGIGIILLDDGLTREIRAGEVVCTPPGAVHGIHNSGTENFIYLSVTTPPQDFSASGYYTGNKNNESS